MKQPCTNDCGGAFHRDPTLARKIATDTGLPICPDALIFQTSSPAMARDATMPGYEVQVMVEGQCPASSIVGMKARLGPGIQTAFETTDGTNVTVSPGPNGYGISVWRVSPK